MDTQSMESEDNVFELEDSELPLTQTPRDTPESDTTESDAMQPHLRNPEPNNTLNTADEILLKNRAAETSSFEQTPTSPQSSPRASGPEQTAPSRPRASSPEQTVPSPTSSPAPRRHLTLTLTRGTRQK